MPPSARQLATRLVVVVLPCVPAMAMPCLRRISSASICARGTTGIVALARGDHFRVVVLDRGRHDHGVGAGDVARRHGRSTTRTPIAGQPARRRAVGEVGTADLEALVGQHLGDAAHAGAADADEVDVFDFVFHFAHSPRSMHLRHGGGGIGLGQRARLFGHLQQLAAAVVGGSAPGAPASVRLAAAGWPRRPWPGSGHCRSGGRPPHAGRAPACWPRRPPPVRPRSARRRGRSPDRPRRRRRPCRR